MLDIKVLSNAINNWAEDKGWNKQLNTTPESIGASLLLMTSEITEAFEEVRNGHDINEIYTKDSKPEGLPIELADCIIRILHFCEYHNIDIEKALIIKMKYNRSRPLRHGGKLI